MTGPGGNVVGLHLAVGGGARLCGETPRGPAHTQAQTPAQARGRSFLPSGLSVAVVDAAFDAGFAAWACVIEGEAHVRTGHAHNSTHAELLAAALAVEVCPTDEIEIRTDCTGALHHAAVRSPLSRALHQQAAKRGVTFTVTHAEREEVKAAHVLARQSFQSRRGTRTAVDIHVTFEFPVTGGVRIVYPGGMATERLDQPLGQAALLALSRVVAQVPMNSAVTVHDLPETVWDLLGGPGCPWHPAPDVGVALAASLHARNVTLLEPA